MRQQLSNEQTQFLNDYDWLYHHRVTNHSTLKTIGKLIGVSQRTVKLHLMKHLIIPNVSSVEQFLQDKTWLHTQHIINRRSPTHIGKELGVSGGTVRRRLKSHNINLINIKINTEARTKLSNYQWLYNEYITNRTSIQSIAESLNVSDSTVVFNLDTHNIQKIDTRITPTNQVRLNDHEWLYEQHITNKRTLVDISTELGVCDSTVGVYMRLHGIDIIKYKCGVSIGEKELAKFIMGVYMGEIITNTKKYIAPQELDIYVPELNIAFEFNGTYWHSELFKDKKYHINKTNRCREVGIRLIHIFEDDWNNNRGVIESKIRQLLNLNTTTIFGRKTEVSHPSKLEISNFYKNTHIQGTAGSSIDIGLSYNTKLVACMSFKKRSDGIFELVRYSSLNVIGGFSKLLCYFKKRYEWRKLISFADLSWSIGGMYEQTGWTLEAQLSPDYKYVVDGDRKHKFGYRHNTMRFKLPKYNSDLSEHQNMLNNKIYRIYDCGLLRYSLENTQWWL